MSTTKSNLLTAIALIDTLHNLDIVDDKDFDILLDYYYLTYGEYYDGTFECDDCL